MKRLALFFAIVLLLLFSSPLLAQENEVPEEVDPLWLRVTFTGNVLQAFGLSAGGETLYLHGGQDGDLTGYVTQARFTASDPGRSFGRAGISTATHDLIPLSGSTPGQTNAESLVDPL